MTVYRSAVDWWIALLIGGAILMCAWAGLTLAIESDGERWLLIALILAGGVFFPLWLFMQTDYRFEGQNLRVRSGPFRWNIPLNEIKAVKRTRNPLSGPALSLNRIQITYSKWKFVLISPKKREDFIRDLDSRLGKYGKAINDNGSIETIE